MEAEKPSQPQVETGLFEFVDGAVYGRYLHSLSSVVVCVTPCSMSSDGGVASVDGRKVRHGRGTYADQHERYSGEWQSDSMHGQGVCALRVYNTHVGGS